MNEPHQEDRRNNHWRFTKDIPLSLLFLIIGQTFGFVWFLAGQNAALNLVIKQVADGQAHGYTKDDAFKDRELLDQRFLNYTQRTEELVRRLTLVEGQSHSHPPMR